MFDWLAPLLPLLRGMKGTKSLLSWVQATPWQAPSGKWYVAYSAHMYQGLTPK